MSSTTTVSTNITTTSTNSTTGPVVPRSPLTSGGIVALAIMWAFVLLIIGIWIWSIVTTYKLRRQRKERKQERLSFVQSEEDAEKTVEMMERVEELRRKRSLLVGTANNTEAVKF